MSIEISKSYVYVISDQTDGIVLPKEILMDDGHMHPIDQIIRSKR